MQILARSLSRREALQRMVAAAATLSLLDQHLQAAARSYGPDPDLHTKAVTWDRVLTEHEMKTVTVLGDTIIPADEKSPAASAVGVPDFINEWCSAPYPDQLYDLNQIRWGLKWLDEESQRRFGKDFADLEEGPIHQICDDIHLRSAAKPPFEKPADFFSNFRRLVAGGFYTTPEGWADIGYVGNKPLAEFPGPPPEVLKHLGLA